MSCSWSWKGSISSFFIIEYDSYKLVINGLFYVEVHSFYTYVVESIYHEGMLNFVKCSFTVSIETIIWFLFFILLKQCITFIYLYMLSHACITVVSSTWSWCVITLMYCWSKFANVLLRVFITIFIEVSLYVMTLFSHDAFKISFVFDFWQFSYIKIQGP